MRRRAIRTSFCADDCASHGQSSGSLSAALANGEETNETIWCLLALLACMVNRLRAILRVQLAKDVVDVSFRGAGKDGKIAAFL